MSALDAFVGLSPSQWCQAFFLVATGTILVIQALPDEARSALMNYGARRPQDIAQEKNGPVQKHSSTRRLFDTLTSYGQVSHSWFLHFYILSCSLSAFWIWQYLSKGSIMRAMAELQAGADAPTVELGQVATAWSFMALQGSRRLYESRFVSKPGSSPMWVVHWGLGLVYYVTMSVAVWIEGSTAILQSWESPNALQLPSRRFPTALVLFVVASLKQNECHRHLAGLKKYSLPSQGSFEYLICPHYAFECLIYIAIAWVAAPQGKLFNNSVLCGLLFVAVNLGATAQGTKKWYSDKFGAEKVAGKWKMIPFVF